MKSGNIIFAAFLLAILITCSADASTGKSYDNSFAAGMRASTDYYNESNSTDGNTEQGVRKQYVWVNPKSSAAGTISSTTGIRDQENYVTRERASVDNQIYRASTGEVPSTVAGIRGKYLIRKRNYLDATDKYLQAKSTYMTAAGSITDYNERLYEADSQEKPEIMKEFNYKAKNYLLSQSSVLGKHLSALKEKYGLNGKISSTTEFYNKEGLRIRDGNLTDEELIDASKNLRSRWGNIYRGLMLNYAKGLSSKINSIAKKGHLFSERFGGMVDGLEESEDKEKLQRGLDIFDEDLNKFETIYWELKQEYADADSDEETDEVLRKGKRLLKEMNQRLMKDFHMLKKMFYHYKKIQAGEDVDSAVLDELLEQMEEYSSLDMAISEEIQN